jgi:hypothetical protein
MIENARSFNWKDVDRVFGSEEDEELQAVSIFEIREREEIERWEPEKQRRYAAARDVLLPILELLGWGGRDILPTFPGGPAPRGGRRGGTASDVIDSLNTIPEEEDRTKIFQHFLHVASIGPKILIVILDSSQESRAAEFWEFASDVVVRLDRRFVSEYMIRTFEICKAHYQVHKWGKHQLKIYEPMRIDDRKSPDQEEASKRMRSHPYRKEGGIFIFPSIHYILSEYKRKSPFINPIPLGSPVENLNRTLYGGFPMGRCVGLIGTRGGHKSHLGYLELLHRIVGSSNADSAHAPRRGRDVRHKALVISLRDDEGMTRQTMQNILRQHWPNESIDLWDLEKEGLLEVMYYPPGYITPEEFFHRLLLSIKWMNRDGNGSQRPHVTLLFNSLDQLASRFPLCAREEIFIPGVIQMLSAEGVSSFFVGAKEVGQPEEYYGLLSMAELILTLDRKSFKKEEYIGLVQSAFEENSRSPEFALAARNFPKEHNAVLLEVVRYAGGQAPGANGILELVNEGDFLFPLYGGQGLLFVPRTGALAPETSSPEAEGKEAAS